MCYKKLIVSAWHVSNSFPRYKAAANPENTDTIKMPTSQRVVNKESLHELQVLSVDRSWVVT